MNNFNAAPAEVEIVSGYDGTDSTIVLKRQSLGDGYGALGRSHFTTPLFRGNTLKIKGRWDQANKSGGYWEVRLAYAKRTLVKD